MLRMTPLGAKSSPVDVSVSNLRISHFSRDGVGVPVDEAFRGESTDELLRSEVARNFNPQNPQSIEKIRGISSAWRIDSGVAGPRVLIFGGIHGLETCGVRALRQLLGSLSNGTTLLTKGSLTLALGNELAISEVQRQVELNLNRLFLAETPATDKANYETRRAGELMSLVSDCDFLLDLHSTSASTEPFGLVPPEHVKLAVALGLKKILITTKDWEPGGLFAGTASQYAVNLGRVGITIENGQHADPVSAYSAYRNALNFMQHAGIIEGPTSPALDPLIVTPFWGQKKERDDFVFARDPIFQNFEFLPKGTVIGRDGNKEFVAEEDCYIVFPTPPQQSKIGVEVYLLARKVA